MPVVYTEKSFLVNGTSCNFATYIKGCIRPHAQAGLPCQVSRCALEGILILTGKWIKPELNPRTEDAISGTCSSGRHVTIHTGNANGQGYAWPGGLDFEICGSEGSLCAAQCEGPRPPSFAPAAVAARRQAAVEFVLERAGLLSQVCILGLIFLPINKIQLPQAPCIAQGKEIDTKAKEPDREIFALLRHHIKHNRSQ
eukprot:scaffold26562_cov18-Tisochrysis_lutea.AAC.1